MIKKGLLFFVVLILATAGAFANESDDSSPKNTVTVDFGPTIIGAAIGTVGSLMGDGEDTGVSTSGFGIGVQYEYQLFHNLSLAGRFAYLGGGIGISMSDGPLKASVEARIDSISIEAHARYYPLGQTFFLDGMLGFASITLGLKGEVIVDDESGKPIKMGADLGVPRGYFKLGAKIGWRIDFGSPGGFVFEPSFGYYAGAGLGDTFGTLIAKKLNETMNSDQDLGTEGLDQVFGLAESYVFAGGPRFSLSFGWKF
jgi:hypothetical protein